MSNLASPPNGVMRLAAIATLLVIDLLLFRAASAARGPVTFDLGPSTSRYVEGFRESEGRGQLRFRWSLPQASVKLPLEGRRGTGTLAIRYARFIEEPTRVRIFVSNRLAATITARSGRFRTRQWKCRFEMDLCKSIW